MQRFVVIKETPWGLLVQLCGRRGKPVKDAVQFWACPKCFDLERGGGILIEPGGYCTNCGWRTDDVQNGTRHSG